MAGTAESGVEAGLHHLFRGRPWVATPCPRTDSTALVMVEAVARALGSHWLVAEAERHDQAVALISHVPVLVSAALLQAVGSERDPSVLALARQLASSGFADTTRVGGGNPQLGTAMAARNTAAVLRGLAAYRWSLEQLEEAILESNWEQLESVLNHTRRCVQSSSDPLWPRADRFVVFSGGSTLVPARPSAVGRPSAPTG